MWGKLVGSDGGAVALKTLVDGPSHGVWEAGIACATTHGRLADHWNTQVTFTADARRCPRIRLARGARCDGRVVVIAGDRHGGRHAARARRPRRAAGDRRPWRHRPGRASPATSGAPAGSGARPTGRPSGSGGAPAVTDVPVAAAACAGAVALVAGLLALVRRNRRAGPTPARREVGAMTLTETALDREMLLVALPDTAVRVTDGNGYDPNEAPRLQAEFDATGHLGEAATTSRWPSVVRFGLIVVALVSIGMVVQLAFVSGIEHRSAQVSLYNRFRTELALGTAPLGPGSRRHPLAMGAPIAQITIPSIGVNQVVVEGTTGTVLADGPGHYRSTVFPGGTGDSIILGRAAAYGGPFGQISTLKKGARIQVITQVGTSVFKVIDVRPAGSKERPVPPGASRLTLGTASGTPFVPSGVVWVDAEKNGPSLAAQPPLVKTVPVAERALGLDTSTLWALALWVLVLAALVGAAVWTWRRRGRAQAWIVFTAPVLLVWMFIADQFARLLPNLL